MSKDAIPLSKQVQPKTMFNMHRGILHDHNWSKTTNRHRFKTTFVYVSARCADHPGLHKPHRLGSALNHHHWTRGNGWGLYQSSNNVPARSTTMTLQPCHSIYRLGRGHQSCLTVWRFFDWVSVVSFHYLTQQLLDRDRQMGLHTSGKLMHNFTASPCSCI